MELEKMQKTRDQSGHPSQTEKLPKKRQKSNFAIFLGNFGRFLSLE